MARYLRRSPPPVRSDYREYRDGVRADFREECAHCLIHEFHAAGREAMELDHFRPQSRFPELATVYENIYYSCHPCNQAKWNGWPSAEEAAAGFGFVDPCRDDSGHHYRLGAFGELIPLTSQAVYTIRKCRLNREHLCQMRRMLSEDGEFSL